MEMVKLVFAVLLLSNAFCQRADVDDWREAIEKNEWPNSALIQDILVRITRKPGTRKYLGLTGRTDSAKSQIARKRHKFQTFVGLMGKRSFDHQGVP